MSGIFGFFNRNGNAAGRGIAEKMLETASYWDPDERDIKLDGPVAFGHTMLWNTPESRFEHLPLQRDGLMLTMDARIDNRDELATQLDLPDRPMKEIGDSEFILAAYRKWGKECPKYLLGDFAFAIWDEQKEQLFLARDHIGVKSLYYYIDENHFVFGNDVRILLTHPSVSRNINEEMLASFLIEQKSHTMTLFSSTQKIETASTMIVSNVTHSSKKYWEIEQFKKIKYKTFEEYKDRLKALIEQATTDRLRSVAPLTSHLSGGLDSSPIAVIAARNLAKRNLHLHTYNWAYHPEQHQKPTHFEWSNSQVIAQKEGIVHEYIRFDLATMEDVIENVDIATNDTLDFWYEFVLRDKVQENDSRIILSGWGGDEFISYGGGRSFYTELFWSGKPFISLRELFKVVKHFHRDNYVTVFIKRILKEIILPKLSKKFFERLYQYPYQYRIYQNIITGFGLVNEPLMSYFKVGISHNEKKIKIGRRQETINMFNEGYIQQRLESWNASAFKNRIEYRYPLLDKRIVEFALGLPVQLFREQITGRFLYRKSIEDLLPKEIIWKDTKFEAMRVEYYQYLLFQYLKQWRVQTSSNTQYLDKYINVRNLHKAIDSIKSYEDIVNDEDILLKAIVILKSIQVLNFGKSL